MMKLLDINRGRVSWLPLWSLASWLPLRLAVACRLLFGFNLIYGFTGKTVNPFYSTGAKGLKYHQRTLQY